MVRSDESGAWFAIQVRPRHEKTVAMLLREKGYEEFLPTYQEKRKWKDRQKVIDSPLFDGYVFCRFKAGLGGLIVTTPGVLRILGSRQGPVAIAEREINAIKIAMKSGLKAEPHPYLTIGSRVVIQDGPLAGIEGILTDYRNRRIVLSINLVQRSVAIEVDAFSLAPARPAGSWRQPPTKLDIAS